MGGIYHRWVGVVFTQVLGYKCMMRSIIPPALDCYGNPMIDIHISLPLHALHMMRRLCGDELHPPAAVIQKVLSYLRETWPREYESAYITPAG